MGVFVSQSELFTSAIVVHTETRIRILKPGGWVQIVELYYQCQSDNGSLTDAHALRQWSNNYIRSLEGIKDPRVATRLRDLLVAAGFVDIEFRMIQLPLCGWSAGMVYLILHFIL